MYSIIQLHYPTANADASSVLSVPDFDVLEGAGECNLAVYFINSFVKVVQNQNGQVAFWGHPVQSLVLPQMGIAPLEAIRKPADMICGPA